MTTRLDPQQNPNADRENDRNTDDMVKAIQPTQGAPAPGTGKIIDIKA